MMYRFLIRFVLILFLVMHGAILNGSAQTLTITSTGEIGTSGTNWSLVTGPEGTIFGNSTLSNGATCLTNGPLWFTPTTSGFITQIELNSFSPGETASLVIKSDSPCGTPTVLGTSGSLTTVAGWNTWTFATPVAVTANVTYYITSDDANNCLGVRWAQSGDDPTTGSVFNMGFSCNLSNTDPASRILVSPTTSPAILSTLQVTGTANVQASVLETALGSRDLKVLGNSTNFQVTVDQSISLTSGTGSLTLGSTTNQGAVTINSPISIIGNLKVYGKKIYAGGSLISKSGDILLDADLGSFTDPNAIGVEIRGSGLEVKTLGQNLLSGATGKIIVRGKGGTSSSNQRAFGVYLTGGAKILTQSGDIEITGEGGISTLAEQSSGVLLSTSNGSLGASEVKSVDGTITINGTGGSGSNYSNGVQINNFAKVSTTGNGRIVISGTAGGAGQHTNHYGIWLINDNVATRTNPTASITAASGDVSLTGQSSNGAGIVLSNKGKIEAVEGSLSLITSSLINTEVSVEDGPPSFPITSDDVISFGGNLTINQSGNSTFSGKLISSGFISGEVPGDGLDNDQNGYIDEVSTLIKSGNGTLTLTGINTFAGATQISGGTLGIVDDMNLGAAPSQPTPGNLILENGAKLQFAVDVFPNSFTLNSNRGMLLANSGGELEVLSGVEVTYNGIIAGAGTLKKSGPSQLNIGAASTYTGGTIIQEGKLFGGAGSQTTPSFGTGPITIHPTGILWTDRSVLANNLVLNGGTLQGTNGFGEVWNGAVSITADSYVDVFINLRFTGAITGSGKLILNNSMRDQGEVVLAGTASHTGGTELRVGVLQIGAGGTTGSLSGNVSTSARSELWFNRSDAYTFSGIISGLGIVNQKGQGSLNLTGSNTYTGQTVVDAGTLLVQGTVAGNATVNSGATLGGIGTVGGLVTVTNGGTLAPGTSTGILTLGNGLTMQTGSTLDVEINGIIEGKDYDQLRVTGVVDLTGSLLNLRFSPSQSQVGRYNVILNDGTDPIVGTFNGITEAGKFYGPGNASVLSSSYVSLTGNDFSVSHLIYADRAAAQTAPVKQAVEKSPYLILLNSDGTPASGVSVQVTPSSTSKTNLPVLSHISAYQARGGAEVTDLYGKAHQFTTGNAALAIEQVEVVLNTKDSIQQPYPLTVQLEASIFSVVNGVPDQAIATTGLQNAQLVAPSTWKTLVFTNPVNLSPSTSYALVLKGGNSQGFKWANVRPQNTAPSGFVTYLDAKAPTLGSPNTWVSASTGNAFILRGNTPEGSTQTLVTSTNGGIALGKWILGESVGLYTLTFSVPSFSDFPIVLTATATATVPEAPTNLLVTPGINQASIAFIPGFNGGAALTNLEYSLDNGTNWIASSPAQTSSPLTLSNLTTRTTYTVKVRGVNSAGTGIASSSVSVTPLIPFSDPAINIDPIANQTYTGVAITPTVVVKDGSTTLTLGTDYTVAYSSNTNVGTATVTITGIGNYTGTKTQTFTIAAKAASTLTIEAIANQIYSGSPITPTVVVKDGSTTLTLGTDYTVAYSSNTNVGTATVTITGIGNYTGTKTQNFTIVTKAASTLTIEAIANQIYSGSPITPTVVVKDGSTTLTLGTDYTVAYSSNTTVGTATVTITGIGNYTGTKTQTFTIVAKAASTLTIDAIANQTYTGSAITPTIVVKDGSTTLTLGTDYTVAYSNNTNVGTATVTITGIGNYTGTKTQTFTIVAKAASTLTIDAIANQTYTGLAITPTVVVKDGSTTLNLGTDYTVAYSNNTNVGTATVTITGIGNYTGTKTQTFTIVAKAASTLTIEAIANQTYTGSLITPTLVVKDGSTTLTLGTDYTVAYSNNTNVGTATVTITGTGNYADTKTQTFNITPKALTIRASNTSKIYGEANPSLSFTYTGLVTGDTEIDDLPSISTPATLTSGVGSYRIILSGGADPNYTITRVEGTLEVTPAPLSLTVIPATKIYGQADPRFAYSVQGLKGTDTETVLRGALDRELGEDPGIYRINQGTVSAGPNYTLTVTGSTLEITKARVLSVVEMATMITDWSKEVTLPATVNVLSTHGQYYSVEAKWDKTTLNLLARGNYSLEGTLILPAGIGNPDKIVAKVTIQVLPKPAPRDVTLNNNTFVGSATNFFIPVGGFVITDPVDKIHTVSLLGPGYDNKFFEIKDNILFWSSVDRAPGKTTFSIVMRVTDRDGNTLDKFFTINRTRSDFNSLVITNAFTPNGDGINDTWGVNDLRFYQGVRISVYDRGGSRLFYTENPDVRWDGTFNGKEMPVASYFWTIEIGETGETRRGMLNLLRK